MDNDTQRCIDARNKLNAALYGEGAVIDDLERAVDRACDKLARFHDEPLEQDLLDALRAYEAALYEDHHGDEDSQVDAKRQHLLDVLRPLHKRLQDREVTLTRTEGDKLIQVAMTDAEHRPIKVLWTAPDPYRWFVQAWGESDRPLQFFCRTEEEVRLAIWTSVWGDTVHDLYDDDKRQLDELMQTFRDPDQWDIGSARCTIRFEIGGIEITELLTHP